LVHAGEVTIEGHAYAAILNEVGFDLSRDRHLTRYRLADHAPGYAAVVRAILLRNPAISFVVRVLHMHGGGPFAADELAAKAHGVDTGMAGGVFGPPGDELRPAEIRPSTRFNLKAGLYDVGILDVGLAPGAAQGSHGSYDPKLDIWVLGSFTSTAVA
jgi:hypothetical protein